jgi:pimeloyl-ACP methyl ester carboxylesterase
VPDFWALVNGCKEAAGGAAGAALTALGAGAAVARAGVGVLDRLAVLPPAVAVGALGCATATVLAVVGEKELADDALGQFQKTTDHILASGWSTWVRDGAQGLRRDVDAGVTEMLGQTVARVATLPLKVVENVAGLVQHVIEPRCGVDAEVVRRAARLAAACAAACDPACRAGLEWPLQPLTAGAAPRGVLSWGEHEVYVALRGSRMPLHCLHGGAEADAAFEDWGPNLNCGLVREDGAGGLVCRGFQSLADEVWPALLDGLAAHPGKTVTLAGHSQGGAVAVLLAARLHRTGVRVREVFQFGAPRVGNGAYVEALPLPCWRFENKNDVVPWLPFHLPTLRLFDQLSRVYSWVFEHGGAADFPAYRHAGALHFINFNDQVVSTDGLWAKELLLENVRSALLTRGGIVLALRDHRMAEYARLLQAQAL